MTTKRKQILKAMAFASCVTMDDLVTSTGLARKNLHDNIASAIKENLCQRIKDDVTSLPAYKLTTKGRQWLENDKDDTASTKASVSKPQPAVGKNTGSKDAGSIVDSGKVGADYLPVGNAVSAPPKPDEMPVAAGADVAHLRDQIAILDTALNTTQATNAALEANANEYQWRLANQAETINLQGEEISLLQNRIALLESNIEFSLEPATELRYIIAENYMTASSEEQANAIALEIAKNIEIDTPVVVFAAHKARELRINWRDA